MDIFVEGNFFQGAVVNLREVVHKNVNCFHFFLLLPGARNCSPQELVTSSGGVGEESESPFNDLLLDLKPKQYLFWRL